ncbi:hypothetical protein SO802_022585 [Lithocarpus litseifolius]|uniref:Peptidase A1 domain-containing protein n=1 Tax=Lithocarpus litseifolius TaxID=425828 RepID=A0AAW2C665_9ROSI
MASGVIFHPCFLLSYYLIGLLVSAHNVPQARLTPHYGHHLMKVSIGTPPKDIYGTADTGSNLVWTPCVPCNDNCFKQIHPLFDPKKSSTYSEISCHSEKCHQVWDEVRCSPQNSCIYSYGYASGLSHGVLAKEKATITSTSGQAVSFDIVFGCGHNNTLRSDAQAIIGLGSGPLSFVSQIGGSRFSYCLLPYGTEYADPSITSKISFGNGSEVVGDGVVSTPFVAGDQYFVTLEGISVGDTYVSFNSSGKASKGNMCIDSGSPTFALPPDFYDRLEVEVKKQIPIDPIMDDPNLGTRLCYRTKITNENGPILTVHFEGADVELKPIQTFNQPLKEYEYHCFGITNTANTELADVGDHYQGIYGNYVQANFLIGFDFETRMVSFKPTDCTKL